MKVKKFPLKDFRFVENIVEEITVANEEITILEANEEQAKEIESVTIEFPQDEKTIDFPTEVIEDNNITITKTEFDKLVQKATEQTEKATVKISEDDILEKIQQDIVAIKEKIDLEFNNLINKTLQIAYAIANKVIEINVMKITEDDFISLLKTKDISNLPMLYIEINSKFADKIAKNFNNENIKITANDLITTCDYRITWDKGFLEKDTTKILNSITDILTKHS